MSSFVSSSALINFTLRLCLVASNPNAIEICVLPTPGAPTRRIFCEPSKKLSVASSRISFSSICGWKLKSNSSKVAMYLNPAFFILVLIDLSTLSIICCCKSL